jgi:hypothetical protein
LLTAVFDRPILPVTTDNAKLLEDVGLVPVYTDLCDKPVLEVDEMNLPYTVSLKSLHDIAQRDVDLKKRTRGKASSIRDAGVTYDGEGNDLIS